MTNEIFWLYLLTRLNAISCAARITMIFAGMILALVTSYGAIEHGDAAHCKKFQVPLAIMFSISVLTLIFVPTKDDAMFIVAGTGVIEAAKTDTAKRLAGKSVDVVEHWLDKLAEKGGTKK